jgi:hypothetical protein
MVAGVGRQYGQRKISLIGVLFHYIIMKLNNKIFFLPVWPENATLKAAPNCGKIAARLPRFGTCFRGFVDGSRVFWHSAPIKPDNGQATP